MPQMYHTLLFTKMLQDAQPGKVPAGIQLATGWSEFEGWQSHWPEKDQANAESSIQKYEGRR